MRKPGRWTRWFVATLTVLVWATTAAAGIRALFSDGFESADVSQWGDPVRAVVFEGFYNPL